MQFIEADSDTLIDRFDWRAPIDTVGTGKFSRQLMCSLKQWAGVEHFAMFSLSRNGVRLLEADITLPDGTELATAPKHGLFDFCYGDLNFEQVMRACHQRELLMLRINPARPWREATSPNQEICDGVFIGGEREGLSYGLSLMRTARGGRFTDVEFDSIRAVAGTWLSLVAKHERILSTMRNTDAAPVLLRSVAEIESKLRTLRPSLTKREAEVCARILRGMSTPGIAIDLAVCEESVATYRKRAYRRLEIGSRFELIELFITATLQTVDGESPDQDGSCIFVE